MIISVRSTCFPKVDTCTPVLIHSDVNSVCVNIFMEYICYGDHGKEVSITLVPSYI